jgi:molybdopterin/thiamine biosynthesis adenylyltransferase
MNILTQSRYDRQERITWWDQDKLTKSRVLVVGAGALGNEIVKNLALVGVGKITIVDMDLIEHTNLSRCIFFRDGDEGKFKAEVLASRAGELNPEIAIDFFSKPVQFLGDGYLANFDLVLAGLDNREARVWLSAACRRVEKILIDGAIEGLMGKVQIFTPTGACYACTMSEKDWDLVAKRKSCTLLGKEEILGGHTPTNSTTSSIIAGVEVQEGVKYLVGKKEMVALENKIWRFTGDQMSSFISIIEPDEYCPFHESIDSISSVKMLPSTIDEFFSTFSLGENSSISFPDDVIKVEPCSICDGEIKYGFADLMKGQGKCENCENELNIVLAKSISRVEIETGAKVIAEFWPMEFIADIEDSGRKSRVAIRKVDNER